ncbi:bifunctional 3-oxoadipate enol-lactonase/4-carboxymuconolactone decarboxylase PcaDC [Herbidospora mongoliensis]|uniref:bifunctional 3-oxoadipate enol-lactonase/4-carboxymuconolactone decarboxylase PcaDC n=1 Tax=Herbidospora mongoliensis TaxID=688067 RepID=UPI0008362422|nr:3-oxoadipate enol-lactonase [Herbidospora mongoliensis]
MLNFRVDGPAQAPALLLGPSLGTSLRVWDAQAATLSRHFRVIRYDLPGHGGSKVVPGATSMEALAKLVIGVADATGADAFHHAGISLGGAIGAWLALRHPDRVLSLTMVCSAAKFGTEESWHERSALVRDQGTQALEDVTRGRWFTENADKTAVQSMIDDLLSASDEGYAECCEALSGYDIRAELANIAAPTLVIAGRDDPAVPPPVARELADGIPGATLTELPGAAHLAPVERPGAVVAAMRAHLPQVDGQAVRRAVLGDEHVDRATANTTDFTADFQDLITRYAWGEIWTRPGLDRRTRSCVTLTALVAGGHQEELAMHVKAAVRNGLTPDEIKEVLLQTAVYCGVPAANAAFAVAQRTLRSLE